MLHLLRCVLLSSLAATAIHAQKAVVPAAGELNDYVLEVLRAYPDDGTHTYHWPRGKGSKWRGCTKDLEYAGETLCAGDEKRRAYCCGLTFEVFLDAWRLWCERTKRPWRIADMKLADVRKLQTQWFGSARDRTCIRTALVENDLGEEVEGLERARPGDFVQLWRTKGSGHSVVFLDWVRDRDESIIGLKYWSTQKSTNGIGTRVEYFERDGKPGVTRKEFYLCRVGKGGAPKPGRYPCAGLLDDEKAEVAGELRLRKGGAFRLRFTVRTSGADSKPIELSGRWTRPAGDLVLRAELENGDVRELPASWTGDAVHYVGACGTLVFRRK